MQSTVIFKQPKVIGLYASFVRTHVKISPWRTVRWKRECYLDTNEKPYTDRHNIADFTYHTFRTLKPWMRVTPKDKDNQYNDYVWHDAYVSDPATAKLTAETKLKRFEQSLIDRQSARETVPYQPPEDVENQIIQMYKSSMLKPENETKTTDEDILKINFVNNRHLKFKFITKCIENFSHDLPTSYLNDIETMRDLVKYFNTPVRGINPYSALVRDQSSLPTNLSLISDAHRYDTENDTFFQGYNALPGIISRVSGLRGKKKYPTLNQSEFQWPDI